MKLSNKEYIELKTAGLMATEYLRKMDQEFDKYLDNIYQKLMKRIPSGSNIEPYDEYKQLFDYAKMAKIPANEKEKLTIFLTTMLYPNDRELYNAYCLEGIHETKTLEKNLNIPVDIVCFKIGEYNTYGYGQLIGQINENLLLEKENEELEKHRKAI